MERTDCFNFVIISLAKLSSILCQSMKTLIIIYLFLQLLLNQEHISCFYNYYTDFQTIKTSIFVHTHQMYPQDRKQDSCKSAAIPQHVPVPWRILPTSSTIRLGWSAKNPLKPKQLVETYSHWSLNVSSSSSTSSHSLRESYVHDTRCTLHGRQFATHDFCACRINSLIDYPFSILSDNLSHLSVLAISQGLTRVRWAMQIPKEFIYIHVYSRVLLLRPLSHRRCSQTHRRDDPWTRFCLVLFICHLGSRYIVPCYPSQIFQASEARLFYAVKIEIYELQFFFFFSRRPNKVLARFVYLNSFFFPRIVRAFNYWIYTIN